MGYWMEAKGKDSEATMQVALGQLRAVDVSRVRMQLDGVRLGRRQEARRDQRGNNGANQCQSFQVAGQVKRLEEDWLLLLWWTERWINSGWTGTGLGEGKDHVMRD